MLSRSNVSQTSLPQMLCMLKCLVCCVAVHSHARNLPLCQHNSSARMMQPWVIRVGVAQVATCRWSWLSSGHTYTVEHVPEMCYLLWQSDETSWDLGVQAVAWQGQQCGKVRWSPLLFTVFEMVQACRQGHLHTFHSGPYGHGVQRLL